MKKLFLILFVVALNFSPLLAQSTPVPRTTGGTVKNGEPVVTGHHRKHHRHHRHHRHHHHHHHRRITPIR